MTKIIIAICVALTFSCSLSLDLEVSNINTLEDAIYYVTKEIKYKSDPSVWGVKDYWQSPNQTKTMKSGDCEDKGILLMYLVKKYLHKDSQLIIAKEGDVCHAYIKYKSKYICSTSGVFVKRLNIVEIYTYDQTMFKCGHGYK